MKNNVSIPFAKLVRRFEKLRGQYRRGELPETKRNDLETGFSWWKDFCQYKYNWRPYDKAQQFIASLRLKDTREWVLYCKSGNKPTDIPSGPNVVYKDKGWVSWSVWLNNGLEWMPFKQAREFVSSLGLKTWSDWDEYRKSGKRPKNIPTHPHVIYKDSGWLSTFDWLGIHPGYNGWWKSFEDARVFVRSLKLKSQREWKAYCDSKGKPADIPANPQKVYETVGWVSLGDWLGTGRIADHLKQFRPFKEAREFVRSLNLKQQKDWHRYCKSGKKPTDIPAGPASTYRSDGWLSWSDWLGTNPGFNGYSWRSFKKAKAFVRSLKLKTNLDWRTYLQSGKKPSDIPATPDRNYKADGWKSWPDFLGTEK